jgi:hypothetical protein
MATHTRRTTATVPLDAVQLIETLAIPVLLNGRELFRKTRQTIVCRRARPLVGMVGIPLALIPALVAGYGFAVVSLVIAAWWWSPRDWHGEWLAPIAAGIVGTNWALMGAVALASFPDDRAGVACAWIGAALLIAAISAYNGRRASTMA